MRIIDASPTGSMAEPDKPKQIPTVFDESKKSTYESWTVARTAVQLIPLVGGPIDTFFAGAWQEEKEARLTAFLNVLSERLAGVESKAEHVHGAEFRNHLFSALEFSVRAQTKSKAARLGLVVANQAANAREWAEADTALRLVADLDDVHAAVLRAVKQAPVCDGPFAGLRVVSIGASQDWAADLKQPPARIETLLPGFSMLTVQMACAELVARALLIDEGLGRMDTRGMELVRLGDLGAWLLGWLSSPENT
jgi:hypothetical protein